MVIIWQQREILNFQKKNGDAVLPSPVGLLRVPEWNKNDAIWRCTMPPGTLTCTISPGFIDFKGWHLWGYKSTVRFPARRRKQRVFQSFSLHKIRTTTQFQTSRPKTKPSRQHCFTFLSLETRRGLCDWLPFRRLARDGPTQQTQKHGPRAPLQATTKCHAPWGSNLRWRLWHFAQRLIHGCR